MSPFTRYSHPSFACPPGCNGIRPSIVLQVEIALSVFPSFMQRSTSYHVIVDGDVLRSFIMLMLTSTIISMNRMPSKGIMIFHLLPLTILLLNGG